jgi:hypothetical protein
VKKILTAVARDAKLWKAQQFRASSARFRDCAFNDTQIVIPCEWSLIKSSGGDSNPVHAVMTLFFQGYTEDIGSTVPNIQPRSLGSPFTTTTNYLIY